MEARIDQCQYPAAIICPECGEIANAERIEDAISAICAKCGRVIAEMVVVKIDGGQDESEK